MQFPAIARSTGFDYLDPAAEQPGGDTGFPKSVL